MQADLRTPDTPHMAPVPATRICPDGDVTEGIDVSYWQETINWNQVAADGVKFAFIRVSYGLEFYDSQFENNWAGAKANGIYRGAYQYFLAGQDAGDQAQMLLDAIGTPQDGDLPPVLDVESYGNDGVSAATVDAGVREWVNIVEAALGRKPLIYTSWGVWSGMTGSTAFGDVPLWVANWGVSCPSVPDGWNAWDFWQTTDSGSIDGIGGNVDLDKFNGGLAALEAYATWEDEPEDTGTEETGTEETGTEDTGFTDTGTCDCAVLRDQSQVCSDGGVRTRDCDGCEWSVWSECEGEGAGEPKPPGGCACGSVPGTPVSPLPFLAGLGLAFARRRRLLAE